MTYGDRTGMLADPLVKRDRQAAGLMLITVFGLSVFPLVVALAGDRSNPFVFHIYFAIPISLVWIGFLFGKYRALAVRRDLWTFTLKQLPSWDGIRALSATFNVALFVAAAHYLDTAIVVVITNAWTLLFVVWQKRSDRRGRYQAITWETGSLLLIAFVGLGLVTISQSGSLRVAADSWRFLVGFVLAVVCALFGSWISYRFKIGLELFDYADKRGWLGPTESSRSELGCQLFVMIVTAVGGILVNLIVVVALPQPFLTQTGPLFRMFTTTDVILITVAAITSSVSSIVFRYANLKTANLGINAMIYLAPVVALFWLWLFDTVRVVRLDFLIVGAMTVIVANALINLRAGDRSGTGSTHSRNGTSR